MPTWVRILFPVLASFGPVLMVIGLQSPRGGPFGTGLAMAGALMTSAALVLVFRVLARLCAADQPR